MARRRQHIVILGLGGIGFYLAKWLAREGYAITAIDPDPARIRDADAEIDARLICADALSFAPWKALAGERIDYVIAVTNSDAVNVTASLMAGKVGARNTIVRVRSLQLWEEQGVLTTEDLGIDLLIRPDELAAREIVRLMRMRSDSVVIDVDRNMRVVATHVAEDSELLGKTLQDLARDYDGFRFRVVAIARHARTIIPGGRERIHEGDHVFVLTHTNDQARLRRILGVSQQKRHRVLIVGGGLIGSRVAELLQDSMSVRLLETDARRAEELSHRLPHTEVLHGDGTAQAVLRQAGLANIDTVVTATGDDEANVLTAALAKHLLTQGRPADDPGRTLALVRKEQYLVLASFIGSDIVLAPKILAGNQILKHIRRGKLLALAHLHGCDAEVIELVPDKGSRITRSPLRELGDLFRDRMLIGGVQHDGDWTIATGETWIQPGDKVIAICLHDDLPELEQLFDK